jgi:glycosyltransferase involved in cell wall biosynthesis
MKILFLTQYYPPEIGAPQNRLSDLAIRLKKKGIEIVVLTAMPNYPQRKIYKEYKRKVFLKEEIEGISVYRSWIFASPSNSIFTRMLNYFSFVSSSQVRGIFIKGKFDFIFCESPPLFLGISAWVLCKIKRAKLIFNVSDLWPESAERLCIIKNKFILKSAKRLEEFFYRHSVLITGQTQGIVQNIISRFPDKKVYWLPNGMDTDFFKPSILTVNSWRKENGFADDDILLLYGGILGLAQKLEVILDAAQKLKKHTNLHFLFAGSGPEEEKLKHLKKEQQLDNVHFLGVLPKNKMPDLIYSITAAIIPLRKLELFKGAIPSKIFETLAMKKPILLGVDGEARELFITNANAGWYFEPENPDSLCNAIEELISNQEFGNKFGENGYQFVLHNFNREIIAESFFKTLQSIKIEDE